LNESELEKILIKLDYIKKIKKFKLWLIWFLN
jgi:hypothetical protein